MSGFRSLDRADAYYAMMAKSFRALCPDDSCHMNVGLWPASSLRCAQESMIERTLSLGAELVGGPIRSVADAGGGWGGTRAIVERLFPGAAYRGVNLASEQVDHAARINESLPNTRFVVGRVEDPEIAAQWLFGDLLVSVEAAFHFEDKAALLGRARERGVRAVSFAEILVEDLAPIVSHRLLASSLRHAWSRAQYQKTLAALDADVSIVRAPGRPLADFAAHVTALDADAFVQRGGRRGLLEQLRRAFSELARLEWAGLVEYAFVRGRFVPPGGPAR